jgi:fumarate reductase flavoprotein subunit
VGAPGSNGLSYQIDQEKCVSCGSCAEACRLGIIFPEGYVKEVKYHDPVAYSCDVLVIGGGAAGLIAAAKTAEAGKQVILLEKLPKLGGGSQFAQGLRMFSTKMDAEAGVPDQMDDYIRSALNTCRWEIDPRLIANAFHALPECFDWMCEWAPVQDSWAVTVSPFGNKMVNTKNGRDAGWFVTQNMEQRCREKGVTILTQHTAKKLVMEQGKVTGVVAEDAGGEVHISCKACLMATGNISYGEVLKKTLPSYYFADSYANSHRMPGNTGDHISMAEDAGISVDYDSVAAAYLGGMIAKGVEGPMMQHVDRGEALKVNKNGKRWINESVNSESAIWAQIKQPGCASFTILDKAILDSKAEAPYRPVVNRTGRNIGEGIPGPDGKFSQNVSFGPPGGHGGPGGPGGPGGAPVDAETALRRAAEYQGGHVFVADTLEELAQKAGIPVESFTATVARYNELCEKGHDDDFYKLPNYLKPIQQAPFFAIRCHMATDGVFGGLDADENVNVLSHGAPVEGLYCAGDTIGNRYINQGGEKLECINDFSWAFASGYLAAKKMLEYLQ